MFKTKNVNNNLKNYKHYTKDKIDIFTENGTSKGFDERIV